MRGEWSEIWRQLDWGANARLWVPPQLVRGPWPSPAVEGFHSAALLGPQVWAHAPQHATVVFMGKALTLSASSFLISRIGAEALPQHPASAVSEGSYENAEEAVRRPLTHQTHSLLPGSGSVVAAQALSPV